MFHNTKLLEISKIFQEILKKTCKRGSKHLNNYNSEILIQMAANFGFGHKFKPLLKILCKNWILLMKI